MAVGSGALVLVFDQLIVWDLVGVPLRLSAKFGVGMKDGLELFRHDGLVRDVSLVIGSAGEAGGMWAWPAMTFCTFLNLDISFM